MALGSISRVLPLVPNPDADARWTGVSTARGASASRWKTKATATMHDARRARGHRRPPPGLPVAPVAVAACPPSRGAFSPRRLAPRVTPAPSPPRTATTGQPAARPRADGATAREERRPSGARLTLLDLERSAERLALGSWL